MTISERAERDLREAWAILQRSPESVAWLLALPSPLAQTVKHQIHDDRRGHR